MPFDPNTLVEPLKARVQDAIVELIPPAEWDKLIREEIRIFFHANNTSGMSFKNTVQTILSEEAKKLVLEMLSSPEWAGQWINSTDGRGREGVSNALADLLKKHMPEIMEAWLGAIIQKAIQAMRLST